MISIRGRKTILYHASKGPGAKCSLHRESGWSAHSLWLSFFWRCALTTKAFGEKNCPFHKQHFEKEQILFHTLIFFKSTEFSHSKGSDPSHQYLKQEICIKSTLSICKLFIYIYIYKIFMYAYMYVTCLSVLLFWTTKAVVSVLKEFGWKAPSI